MNDLLKKYLTSDEYSVVLNNQEHNDAVKMAIAFQHGVRMAGAELYGALDLAIAFADNAMIEDGQYHWIEDAEKVRDAYKGFFEAQQA